MNAVKKLFKVKCLLLYKYKSIKKFSLCRPILNTIGFFNLKVAKLARS